MSHDALAGAIDVWGGIECTVNRVGDRWFDQVVRTGHETRPDDLVHLASLGIRALRYPVLWERMAPGSLADIDWRWSDERLLLLRDLGIRPIIGLVHHGSGPAYTSLLSEDFPQQLAAFAAAVAERYPWVSDFTPINEPLTTARFSALYGHWYPHARSAHAFVRALLTQMRGVVLAMQAIRRVIPHARLLQTEDCGRTFGSTETVREQVVHESHRRWLTWDLLAGRVTPSHPLYEWLRQHGATEHELAFFVDATCRPDLLGLNYYVTSDRLLDDRLDRYPAWTHGGNGTLRYADVEAVRARREGIVGHAGHLLEAWQRYQIPVGLSEVHLACTDGEQCQWLLEAMEGAYEARDAGADVRFVAPWALLGAYDWDSLVTVSAGSYEAGAFDVRDGIPRETALASTIRHIAAGTRSRDVHSRGWWRRAERMSYPPCDTADIDLVFAAQPADYPLACARH